MQALTYIHTALLTLGAVVTMNLSSAAGATPAESLTLGGPVASQSVQFVPNHGQWPEAVSSAADLGGLSVWFEKDGWVLDLQSPAIPAHDEAPAVPARGAAVRMHFLGADAAELTSSEVLPGVRNYLQGNDPSAWVTGVPAFAEQRYESLYPGVDVVTMGEDGNVRYDLHLAPGAQLDRLVVRCEGADALELLYDGSLAMHTALGPIVQAAPTTWVVAEDGTAELIDCSYVLLGDDRFGFVAPDFDGTRPLVIDPTITWATFLGGSNVDYGWATAVDDLGQVTVAGFASPSLYPTTTGAYDGSDNGNRDGFVTRMSADGSQLVFSTLIGGTGLDEVRALAIDANGGVVLGGLTNSANFPVTPNNYGQSFSGGTGFLGSDAFVAHLDALGGALLSSAFIGGTGDDYATSVGVDDNGQIFAAGVTASADFPVTPGALQPTYSGGSAVGDAFAVCLSSDGTVVDYATYLGGSQDDVANALLVESNGTVTVAGWTSSSDFNVTNLGVQSVMKGTSDAWIVTLDTATSQLTWGTMLGGSSDENAVDIDRDDDGKLLVVGTTRSPDFPLTQQATDTSYGGGFFQGDGFVTRFSADGTSLGFSTFLGGNSDDGATAVTTTPQGFVAVTGSTTSSDWMLDGDPLDTQLGGSLDAFITVIDATDGVLLASSYLGGGDNDKAWDVEVLADGQVIVAGYTTSYDFPVTAQAFDPVFDGAPGWISDVFVTSLDLGFSVTASVDWLDLGNGLAGAYGLPELTALGSLAPQVGGSLDVTEGRPSARGRLLLGGVAGNMPLKGGILVPFPIMSQVLFRLDSSGYSSIPFANSGLLPSGMKFYVQVWIQDNTGPNGWTATNALEALVP